MSEAKPRRRSTGSSLFARIHVFLYRLTGGRLGGVVMGQKIVIMHVIGRRSGKVYPTPVVGVEIDGEIYVAASHGGAPVHPVWFFNLQAHPAITITWAGRDYPATAETLSEPERSRIWDEMTKRVPIYIDTQKRTERIIPVIRLRRA